MGKAQIILTVISIIVALVCEGIPMFFALRNKGKKLADAKTTAEKADILADMCEDCQRFIVEAEQRYSTVKSAGINAGAFKKDFVISRMQMIAAGLGIDFDFDYWNRKIDELVALTKKVNH